MANPLRDPPQVAFRVGRPVAPVSPIIRAVIVELGFVGDARAGRARPCAVGVDIVDVDQEFLGIGPADAERAGGVVAEALRGAPAFLADHDEAIAVGQFAVGYTAVFPFDAEPYLEAKGLAEPVDHGGRIPVKKAGRNPRPAAGRGFHGSPPLYSPDPGRSQRREADSTMMPAGPTKPK